MSNLCVIKKQTMNDIADAIREKSSSVLKYLPSQMAQAIQNLPTGGGEAPDIPNVTVSEWSGGYCYYSVSPVSDPSVRFYLVSCWSGSEKSVERQTTLTEIQPNTSYSLNMWGYDGGLAGCIVAEKNGVFSSPYVFLCTYGMCLMKGTMITLYDKSQKPIEDITYDDELLVWDFDNGCFSYSNPIWIKKPEMSDYYFINKLSDGRNLITTGKSKTGWGHRMFDESKNRFVYTTCSVGDVIRTIDGTAEHMSCTKVNAPCENYNVITRSHFNLFANGILTSCSLNNLYPIENGKFVKDNSSRKHTAFDFSSIPMEYIDGLRLVEQDIDIVQLNEYVQKLILNKK